MCAHTHGHVIYGVIDSTCSMEPLLHGVKWSVCQIREQVCVIFEHSGLRALTIACLPSKVAWIVLSSLAARPRANRKGSTITLPIQHSSKWVIMRFWIHLQPNLTRLIDPPVFVGHTMYWKHLKIEWKCIYPVDRTLIHISCPRLCAFLPSTSIWQLLAQLKVYLGFRRRPYTTANPY